MNTKPLPIADLDACASALSDAGIEAAFPQTDFAKLAVIARGFGSVVLGVRRRVVVRIPRSEEVAAAHGRERALLPLIAAHVRIAVPEVTWAAPPASRLPWGASAYPWIEGASPSVPVAAGAALPRDLAGFLARLHAVPLGLVGGLGLAGRDDLARDRADAIGAIEPVLRARLGGRELDRLHRRLGEIVDDPHLDDYVPVLRHGDPWWGNTLIDEGSGRLRAVLDWEHAAAGDPAEDLAPQRDLGVDADAAVRDAYAQLVGGVDERFHRRVEHHFALREVMGIRRCIETNDDEEIDEELRKLRAGPLLA